MKRVVISGGGTGGHIFPAIAIADELRSNNLSVEILFIGALGNIEMKKVPEAGYKIIGLNIVRLQRKLTWSNVVLPLKMIRALITAKKIIKEFKPDVVIGVGGFASWAALTVANKMGIPTVIQEQNSFPGKTNKLLAKKASLICVGYSEVMEYFKTRNIVFTGNPVRKELMTKPQENRAFFLSKFGIQENCTVILILGGSLGSSALNDVIIKNVDNLDVPNVKIIWQVGNKHFNEVKSKIKQLKNDTIQIHNFIDDIVPAMNIANIIISSAGATSIAEYAVMGKAVILIPNPHAPEDHQTKNAKILADKNAVLMIQEQETNKDLIPNILSLIENNELRQELANNLRFFGNPLAAKSIVDEVEKIVNKKRE